MNTVDRQDAQRRRETEKSIELHPLEAVVDAWCASEEIRKPKRIASWMLLLDMARHVDSAGTCRRSQLDLSLDLRVSTNCIERHQHRWREAGVLRLEKASTGHRPSSYAIDITALRAYADRTAQAIDEEPT
jgi:hypothetical protein